MYTNALSGIYRIDNKETNKFYIGSSMDIYARWATHKHLLNTNKHSSKHLQNAWNLYGGDKFEFSIIELTDVDKLIEREQYYLDLYKTYDQIYGYNILRKAGTTLGFEHSDETKLKISNSTKGKPKIRRLPKKIKIKIARGAKLKGRKYSEEHKNKISASNKNRVLTEEHKANLRKPKKKRAINGDKADHSDP